MSDRWCSISSLFRSTLTLSFLWQLFNSPHLLCLPPVGNGFTQLFTIHGFLGVFWNERWAAMCFEVTLPLPGIKCFLLIKMTESWRILGKEALFVLCQWNRMVISYPIEIFDHPAVCPQWGQWSVRGWLWHSCGCQVEPVMDDRPEWATLPSEAAVLTGLAFASHIQHQ